MPRCEWRDTGEVHPRKGRRRECIHCGKPDYGPVPHHSTCTREPIVPKLAIVEFFDEVPCKWRVNEREELRRIGCCGREVLIEVAECTHPDLGGEVTVRRGNASRGCSECKILESFS